MNDVTASWGGVNDFVMTVFTRDNGGKVVYNFTKFRDVI